MLTAKKEAESARHHRYAREADKRVGFSHKLLEMDTKDFKDKRAYCEA